jgi:Dolichyl-phosphate-mannose-protein mannosyltransferase
MGRKSAKAKSVSKQFPSPDSRASNRTKLRWKVATIAGLSLAIWLINAWWLSNDTRPPVWDMASHQIYALNYLGAQYADPVNAQGAEASGMYPPFVHWLIALIFLAFGPHPAIAPLVNLPATFILLYCTYDLTSRYFDESSARWSCVLTAAIPYLIWMSRETILDYWLMALVVAGIAALLRTQGFRNRRACLAFGVIIALGLLTKWLYPIYLAFPFLYVAVRERIWKSRKQRINAFVAGLCAIILSGIWYFPRLAALSNHFAENAQVGAMEGEPEIFSFQSFIYYLRLLEGYQLFALLFAFFVLSWIAVWRKRHAHKLRFFALAVFVSWIGLTLIRTKDPRFRMPLLPLLSVAPGVWIASWRIAPITRIAKICLALLLCFQLYLTNAGVAWLPQEIVLMRGYQGSLRWDWNLYLQHYFHILGPPRVEDWKQKQILEAIRADAASSGRHLTLGFIPDMPRFSVTNFHLYARLSSIPLLIYRLVLMDRGIYPLADVDYVIATDGDQGMPWTTQTSRALTQLVNESDVFQLLKRFPLPDGSVASLYAVDHSKIKSQ